MATGAKFTLSFVTKYIDNVTAGLHTTGKSLETLKNRVTASNGKLGKLARGFTLAETRVRSFNRTLVTSGQRLEMMGSSIQRMGRWLALSITAPIVLFAKKAGESFLELEKNLNFSRVLLGATGAEMENLTGLVRELGATTEKSAIQVSSGVITLARAGQSLKDVSANLPAIINLSTAAQTTMAKATTILTDVLGAYKLEASESARIVDILAKVSSRTKTDLLQLGRAMGMGASTGKMLGLRLTETTAIMATFAETGLRSGRAGRAFRRLMSSLASPTKKFAAAAADMNLKLFVSPEEARRTGRRLRDVIDIVKEFEGATDKFGRAKIQDLLSTLSQNAKEGMNSLLLMGSEGFGLIEEAAKNATGFGKEMADVFRKGMLGALVDLKNKFEDLLLTIMSTRDGGLGMSAVIVDMTKNLTKLIQKFTIWIKENPKLAKTLGKIVLAAAAIGPILVLFGSLSVLTGLVINGLGKMVGAIAFVGDKLGWFGLITAGAATEGATLGMTLGVIGTAIKALAIKFAIFVAIGVAVAGIVKLIMHNWDSLVPFFEVVGSGMSSVFDSVLENGSLFVIGTLVILSRAKTGLGLLKEAFMDATVDIRKTVTEFSPILVDTFDGIWNDITKSIINAVEFWNDELTVAFDFWKEKLSVALAFWKDFFANFVKDFIESFKADMQSIINSIPAPIRKILKIDGDTTDVLAKLKDLQQKERDIQATSASRELEATVSKLKPGDEESEALFKIRKEAVIAKSVAQFNKERDVLSKIQQEELAHPEKVIAEKIKQFKIFDKIKTSASKDLKSVERDEFNAQQKEDRKTFDESLKLKILSINALAEANKTFAEKQKKELESFSGKPVAQEFKTPVINAKATKIDLGLSITNVDKTVNGVISRITATEETTTKDDFVTLNTFSHAFVGNNLPF